MCEIDRIEMKNLTNIETRQTLTKLQVHRKKILI